MFERFGPWSSALNDGPSTRLSTFWKRRLAMLASARSARLGLSRRNWLKLGAAGAATGTLPTLRFAPAGAPVPDDARPAAGGKIYARVIFIHPAPGGPRADMGLFAIDPTTGAFERFPYLDGGIGFSLFSLSRDGRKLALLRYGNEHGTRDADLGSVWTLDTEGRGEMRRVADLVGPVSWSPDGRQLIVVKFLSKPGEGMRTETWLFNADGSGATRLPIPEADAVEDWSPDGRWLVTVSDRRPPRDRGNQLYVMRPDGTEQRRLTEGPSLNVHPRFSPDGRRIAYHRQDRDGDSIWVVDIDGGGRRLLLREENDVFPEYCCWSPDGKALACTVQQWQRDELGRKFSSGGDSYPRLVIVDAEGKDRRTLELPHAQAIEWPAWR